MIKYAVIKRKESAKDESEIEDIGIFDTEDEAFKKADEVFADFDFVELLSYKVEVGEISEDDLEDKDDWHSYRKIEIIDIKDREKPYKVVDNLFEGLMENIVKSEPYKQECRDPEVYIHSAVRHTLKDGTVIEIVFWSEAGWNWGVYDISVSKETYDAEHSEPFEEYMRNMGLYTENVQDGEGDSECHWEFYNLGVHEASNQYRLQYIDSRFWA